MRFMVLVPASKETEAGVLPTEKELAEMGKFNEELVNAGMMLAGEGLHPTSKGARIRFSGGKTTVTDGPFTESKEMIAGFWLIQAKSKDEAIAWMKRAPFGGGIELEIRQVFESEEFGSEFTPELREQEERLRAQVTAKPQRRSDARRASPNRTPGDRPGARVARRSPRMPGQLAGQRTRDAAPRAVTTAPASASRRPCAPLRRSGPGSDLC